jgi:hypothetical protein
MASTLRLVLPPFVAGKLVTLLVPMLTVWSSSSGPVSYADLVRPFGSWDGESYRAIAEHGYPGGPLDLTPGHPGHLWAFLPGYPMLLRAAMVVIPDATTAGLLVSAACELIALVFLAKLVLHERHGDTTAAQTSAWLLVLYPYAVFLTAVYTESPFLAAATASLYFMRRGDHIHASVLAAVAVCFRITGLALVPALLVEYLLRRRLRPDARVLACALPFVPLLLYAWYAHATTGDTLAYWHVEQSASFNRMTAWPWDGARATYNLMLGGGANGFIFGMELLFGILGAVAIAYLVLHRDEIAPSLIVFAGFVWVISISLVYWLSVPRYTMAMVPMYLAGADAITRLPWLRLPALAALAGWMGFVSTLLGTGRFVA